MATTALRERMRSILRSRNYSPRTEAVIQFLVRVSPVSGETLGDGMTTSDDEVLGRP